MTASLSDLPVIPDGADPRALASAGIEVWASLDSQHTCQVSNLGRAAWVSRGKVYTTEGTSSTTVYRSFFFPHRTMLAHRAVVLAFDGEPKEHQTDVRHLDGNPTNNRLDNLAYGTRSENMQDARKVKLRMSLATPREGSAWFGGTPGSLEDYLTRAFVLAAEGKVTLLAIGQIFNISPTTVSRMFDEGKAEGRWTEQCPDARAQKRLPSDVRQKIRDLVREGKTREEVNEALSLSLTHQDFYYYKNKK